MTGTETNRAATAPCKFFTPPAQRGKRRARTARRGQAASAARPSALFPLDSHLSYTRRTRGGRGCQAGQDWPRSEKIPAPADPPALREFSQSLTASHLPSRCTEEQPNHKSKGMRPLEAHGWGAGIVGISDRGWLRELQAGRAEPTHSAPGEKCGRCVPPAHPPDSPSGARIPVVLFDSLFPALKAFASSTHGFLGLPQTHGLPGTVDALV